MIVLRGNKEEDVLSIKLRDILEEVPGMNCFKWKLLWLDGVSFKLNIGKIMDTVDNCQDGYLITIESLLKLSDLSYQLLELVLIGDKEQENLHKLDNDDEMKKKCEFFIELVDSSYWEITSSNESFINNIKDNFTFEEV